ncbi:adenylate/guanylate cyclase domain-containing protein [Antrihabitans sp. NCIMB 15449]|uniref:Adenylate/guanylate cyclase domain-containing protein n=1 Tax=Antrihabitans spumae TaxID=3373370 RepID=A0ABW7JTE5_9NOCA
MNPPADWKRRAFLLRVRYSVGILSAYVIGAIEVLAIIALLSRGKESVTQDLFTVRNIATGTLVLTGSLIVAAVCTTTFVVPALVWYSKGETPTEGQAYAALEIPLRQTLVHVGMWFVGGAAIFFLNLHSGLRTLALIALGVVFGGAAIACLGYLVTQQTLRPIIAVAMSATPPQRPSPGVMQRLIATWALCTAIPTTAICAIIVDRYTEWVIAPDTPIEAPILILAATSLGAGLRGLQLVAQTVSDPVREVGRAMREVEKGNTDVTVSVYDSSEIGRLQMGFNQMVASVAERERLQDLFGKHVGQHVASRAMEEEPTLGGDVRVVAVLFIDLAGSTTLAATHPPTEVAEVLNDFFHIVVTAVDEHEGLINKFTGDAALAIFGAPQEIDDPAGAALATARALRTALRALTAVDFGIGVSHGSVFAGNIGAEHRYEYTVIGDPVNEAARLTELAKDRKSRILAARQAVWAAAPEEAAHWASRGSTKLRGRTSRTVYAEPSAEPD